MAIFTKTFVRCDACEEELEVPNGAGGGDWYRVKTEIRRLDTEDGEPMVKRSVELCPRCYSALQDSEFSTLFEAERKNNGEESSVVPITGGE